MDEGGAADLIQPRLVRGVATYIQRTPHAFLRNINGSNGFLHPNCSDCEEGHYQVKDPDHMHTKGLLTLFPGPTAVSPAAVNPHLPFSEKESLLNYARAEVGRPH